MLSLLNADFLSKYGILIVLAVALGLLMFMSFNRRKRDESVRNDLLNKIATGVKVKTYGGIYGTVVSIEETTDGKIVLLESGEGKKVSYQNIHINAIYGVDDKQPVVLDADGNQVFNNDNNFVDLDKLERERLEQKAAESVAAEEVVVEEQPAKTTKPKTTKAKTATKK